MPRPRKKPAHATPPAAPVADPVYVKVRELRANFKQLLESDRPVIVGNHWRPRAIVIPVPSRWYGQFTSDVAAHAHVRALFARAMKSVGGK